MRIIFTGIIILFITGCTTTMEYEKKLKISGKEIDLKKSELLFEEDFSSGKISSKRILLDFFELS